jgi:hypothetical protein
VSRKDSGEIHLNAPAAPRWLPWLIAINIAATVLHYVDNVLFFPEYPEPAWMTPHFVDAFWFVMTPFAIAGHRLFSKGHPHWGSAALYAYSAMSLLALGHYLYAPICSMGWRINAFILLEAVVAACLIAGVALLQARRWLGTSRCDPGACPAA